MFFCRLCTISCDHFFVVTHRIEGKSLSEWIMELAGLEIDELDGLPRLVCKDCLDELERFTGFKKKCLESDNFWRDQNSSKCNVVTQFVKKEEEITLEETEVAEEEEKFIEQEPLEEVVYEDEFIVTEDLEEQALVEEVEEEVELVVEDNPIDVVEEDAPQECWFEEEYLENEEEVEVNHEGVDESINQEGDSEGNVLCCGCGQMFHLIQELMQHAKIHADDHKSTVSTKTFECQICHRKFVTMKRLQEHHQDRSENKLKCPICDIMMSCSRNMTNHLNSAHGQQEEIKCNVCGKLLRSKATLKKHLEIHNPNRTADFPCDICNQKFYEKSEVSRHRLIHTGFKPHKCSFCPKSFRTRWELKVHCDTHNKMPGVFKCRYCPIQFDDSEIRKTHEEDNHKISCNFCSKTFGRKVKLVVHMRKAHTHERPYKCEYCDKDFAATTDLKKHVQKTHSEDFVEAKCNICLKILSSTSALNKHIRTHDPNRAAKFLCTTCGTKFYEKSELIRHTMIHTGVKPFECNQCEKSFKRRWELSVHTEVHNKGNGNTIKCRFCMLRFEDQKSRDEHIQEKHEKHCDFCGKTFTRRGDLVSHLLKYHSNEAKEDVCIKPE